MGRDDSTTDITVGQYLLTRLSQLGVTSMFGVPGAFNTPLLDLVENYPKIEWIGSCNELNAAYAADGYARVNENSLGVVCTTFGTGELLALNGIAGGFAEMVPILHIVGVPSSLDEHQRSLIHPPLGVHTCDDLSAASTPLIVHSEHLNDRTTSAHQIDVTITQCITKARPVYLTLPTDLVDAKISGDGLKAPISRSLPPNEPHTEEAIIGRIEELVHEAQADIVVLVDACALRHHVRSSIIGFLKKTGFPVYATPMGKTLVPEDYERFGGIYIGAMSHPDVRAKVEGAKLIMSFGLLPTDVNTGGFTHQLAVSRHVELQPTQCRIQSALFLGIALKELTLKLTERLKIAYDLSCMVVATHEPVFRPTDIIVSENANFGVMETPMPGGAMLLSQILYGSIGWSVGCTLGAAVAAKNIGMERVILIVGDGSLQMTVQELSTMIDSGLTPIIFVIKNRGYTIERFIRGMRRKYNDVVNWRWTALLDMFNADPENIQTASYSVSTKQDMDKLLRNPEFVRADKFQLVEVLMDAFDAPVALQRQAELVARSKGSD